jgi:hypothetical protein
MTKRILMLTTVTFALVCGAVAARAQQDTDDAAMMRKWEEVQQNPGDEGDTGMAGHGMARHCIRQCMAEEGTNGLIVVVGVSRRHRAADGGETPKVQPVGA